MTGGDAEDVRRINRARRLEKLRFWHRANAERGTDFTILNEDRSDPPLIFFHGDFTMGGYYLRRIAAAIDRRVVAVAPHGMLGASVPETIEGMAEDRLREIVRRWPRGPYRLGGYCNGALVAYECARRLHADGHSVDLIVLLEPNSLNLRPAYKNANRVLAALLRPVTPRRRRLHAEAMKLVWAVPRLLSLPLHEVGTWAAERFKRWRRAQRRVLEDRKSNDNGGSGERDLIERNKGLTAIYTRACAVYSPLPLDVPLLALSTGRDGGGRPYALFDGKIWQTVTTKFRHVVLPGDHSSCLADHGEFIGLQLRAALDAISPQEHPSAPHKAPVEQVSADV